MEAGKHGLSGSWEPGHAHFGYNETFSYGIFEWLQKASGKGVKKGAVKVRVSGPVSRAEDVKAKAQEIATSLDIGTYAGPKNVRVK